jgi:hypothetical protein
MPETTQGWPRMPPLTMAPMLLIRLALNGMSSGRLVRPGRNPGYRLPLVMMTRHPRRLLAA